ncbi:tetratricopeptide repeat protein [Candidatus Fermentibacteria bacterium]|nr:tetratricopeptide repeat protein [Candidatus Fermentibacteria bacterium]
MTARFLLPALALACGCAYFNTFYNARERYEEAEALAAASPENPSPQEAELLEKAIEGAGKVLSFHPGSRWADDAQLLIGDALLLLGRRSLTGSGTSSFQEAMKAYASVMLMTDDEEIMDRASLGMGRAAMQLSRWQDAAAVLENVSDRDRRLRIEARLLLSRSLRLDGRPAEALAALDSLLLSRMSDSLHGEVLIERSMALLDCGLPDSAARVAAAAAELFRRGDGFYRALVSSAEALIEAGRPGEAAGALTPLLASYRSDLELARISLLQGRAQELAGDTGGASSSYRDAADLDGSREVGAEALYRRALLLESSGDLDGSIEDLRELAERPGEYLWIRLAAERLADLELLAAYTDSLSSQGSGNLDRFLLLAAEKRLDLYGADSLALSHIRFLSASSAPRIRAMAMVLLSGLPGVSPDSSRALLLEARALSDSGDLATRIEEELGLPRGPGWAARPSVVLGAAWDMIDSGLFAEAWESLSRTLSGGWSEDARPALLWAAAAAAEGAGMEDDLVEDCFEELVRRFPGTEEGRAASARLGGSGSGDGGGGGE